MWVFVEVRKKWEGRGNEVVVMITMMIMLIVDIEEWIRVSTVVLCVN